MATAWKAFYSYSHEDAPYRAELGAFLAGFLASDYCFGVEMERSFQRLKTENVLVPRNSVPAKGCEAGIVVAIA